MQVFLASVKRVGEEGTAPVSKFTPMNLLWSYRGSATLPALLPEMPPVYCDLAHVEQPGPPLALFFDKKFLEGAELALDVEFPSNTYGHVLDRGTYLFHLILAAANCRPRHYRYRVMFPGKWYVEEQDMFREGFAIETY